MVEVSFDSRKIYDEIQKSTDVSLSEIADQIVSDTEPFVPKRTGMLRESVTIDDIDDGIINISYSRPLLGKDVAEEVNMGINPNTGNLIRYWTTPGTGPDWFGVSKDANLDAWVLLFRERTREIWRARGSRKRAKK